jgi:hypothetical protein
MEPGRATNSPPPFPEGWCGLWKDPLGKVMFIRREHDRHLAVSFAAGIDQNFFGLPTSPIGITRHLPGVYLIDPYGAPVLQIDIGDPQYGPRYDIHFVFGEGDRLRTAEPWDIVSGIIARPKLAMGYRAESADNTELAWAYPLSNYWKVEEEEAKFLAARGGGF